MPAASISSMRRSKHDGAILLDTAHDQQFHVHQSPSRRSTSRAVSIAIVTVAMCGFISEVRADALSKPLSAVHKTSAALEAKPGPEFVARSIRDGAKSIEKDVDGIKKAVDSAKLEMTKRTGPVDDATKLAAPVSSVRNTALATNEEKIQKMKSAVHAAAMIKQERISHSLPSHESHLPNAEAAAKKDDGRGRNKVTTVHDPKWFAEGPYVIIGLLVTIFFTFCCCAFSSQPTSMSNKYDMR
mmetsp:Transcript_8326/g.16599  ORF Transcript_8326/g.16599 Transcript_8326/m.16599 type:complete len:242 (-) Transcript_8326:288-1013(-)